MNLFFCTADTANYQENVLKRPGMLTVKQLYTAQLKSSSVIRQPSILDLLWVYYMVVGEKISTLGCLAEAGHS